MPKNIEIKNASTHNLKNVSLNIPHHQLIVITGVSGSGKSSLIFDVLAREGQRRYFETIPSFAKQFLGKLKRPEVEHITGLSPVITIGQKAGNANIRSTVGTISDIYDLLRLLYARFGQSNTDINLSRSLFSFNSSLGWCPVCKGIGKEEKIDINKLVSHPEKTIREGALAPTLPTGYIMYSQVTMDVLNQVCEAEGFNVDYTWNELNEEQRNVILYGSEKIKVPFGKHSLESRLKWTGIKAKPREEGYFKGMITIMSDILKRDRNPNILKYAHSVRCSCCNGKRLNQDALSATVKNVSIATISEYTLSELKKWINDHDWKKEKDIIQKILTKIKILESLGLGHLTINRPVSTISGSEIQRIRLCNQTEATLSNVLYVFDEPSIGLHPSENLQVISLLRSLVNQGNTVMVIEHDLETINQADWIIDIGPGAGKYGGEILFNGSLSNYKNRSNLNEISPTYRALHHTPAQNKANHLDDDLKLIGCTKHRLSNLDITLKKGQINVISGVSGSGKKSLVLNTILPLIESNSAVSIKESIGFHSFNKTVFVDQSPIGRTPRSNPATYIGLSDKIRDLFASLPQSKELKFTKSRYSFNNKGGRCEACQGAGKTQIGMHFLGKIDSLCGVCNGKRFNEETLQVEYNGKSIADIYEMSVSEAKTFFDGHKKILPGIQTLYDLGLGYLKLGQSSTTLSGGEAQRIKLASELQKKSDSNTFYMLNLPCTGLHFEDINKLLSILNQLTLNGSTILCIEQDEQFIYNSNWHIELGKNGHLIYQGTPKEQYNSEFIEKSNSVKLQNSIQLIGVTTHQLKNIDVSIPKNQLSVVTGLSGSGKTSLVFDTLYAEAHHRFSASFSTYQRSFLQLNNEAKIKQVNGLTPTIAIKKIKSISKRSTVGTISGLYDYIRLLYSRISELEGLNFSAQQFSFNHEAGACVVCDGKGVIATCNQDYLIKSPDQSILTGALVENKSLKYYSNPDGQFIALLKEVANYHGIDLEKSWNQFTNSEKEIILYGTGEKEWETEWNFKTKTRTGTQNIKAKWMGFCGYIDDEYYRKLHNKDISSLQELIHDITCEKCNGSRLKSSRLKVLLNGLNIQELTKKNIDSLLTFLEQLSLPSDKEKTITEAVLPKVFSTLKTLVNLGLGHLSLSRSANTLSGGEIQRLSLAGNLSAQLFGVTYVLDEPSVGLDSQQVMNMVALLKQLVENGNTVVVIEHDKQVIEQADYLIELGPGSGASGGNITYQGRIEELINKHSLTYQLIHNNYQPAKIKCNQASFPLKIFGANKNNLKHIDVQFQSDRINAVTGVSGSGKSSLINEVLYQSYLRNRPEGCDKLEGFEQFNQIVSVNQEPIALNMLTTPVTYTGIMDLIKGIYSKSDLAKELKLKRADFSYQSKNGKCPTCLGYGKIKTSMDFMSDVWNPCDTCNGLRYSKKVLDCVVNDYSIGHFLQLSVKEALEITSNTRLTTSLELLAQLGLEHIALGQAGNTLSGGEAQRLKLAKHLLQHQGEKNLYILDEPSTGLHEFDIHKLINVLNQMILDGHTIIMVEHHSTLLNIAHEKIVLGPGCGESGGEIIFKSPQL